MTWACRITTSPTWTGVMKSSRSIDAARVERERIEREQAEAAAEEKRKAERRARAEQLKPVKRRLETFAKSLRETPAPEGLPPAVAAALGDVLDRAADAVLVLAQGLEVRP